MLTEAQYQTAALNHLSGPTYKKVRAIKAETVEKRINARWKEVANEAGLPKSVVRQFTSNNSRHPVFYCLPKTHMQEPLEKVRPIFSSIGSPDRKLVWLLYNLLNDLVHEVSSHLSSSHELMQKINSMSKRQLLCHSFSFSLDVNALYTFVPVSEAIQTVSQR